jgi:hypothetical protein
LFFKILARLSFDGTSQLLRRLDSLLLRRLMGRELDLAFERDLSWTLSAFSRMRFANSLTSTYDGFLYHVSQAGNCMVKGFAWVTTREAMQSSGKQRKRVVGKSQSLIPYGGTLHSALPDFSSFRRQSASSQPTESLIFCPAPFRCFRQRSDHKDCPPRVC